MTNIGDIIIHGRKTKETTPIVVAALHQKLTDMLARPTVSAVAMARGEDFTSSEDLWREFR